MSQEPGSTPQSRRSTLLLVLTSIYGVLYLALVVSGQYGTTGSEPAVVKALALVFLVGYVVVWLDERAGGVVFVLWYAGMCYLALFVVRQDRGVGVVLGAPLLALGISFIVSWTRRRDARMTAR